MRNGVTSKRRFVYSILQFVFGIVVGHFCFLLRDISNGKIVFKSYTEKCFNFTSIHNSSNFIYESQLERNFDFEELGTKYEFLEEEKNFCVFRYDRNRYQISPPEMTTKSDDASFSGNFTSITKKDDLLFVGVLTSNKFLQSRACTVYNTWAKHIQVIFYNTTRSMYL